MFQPAKSDDIFLKVGTPTPTWLFEFQAQFYRFPAKCNNLGRPIKMHLINEKLVPNVKKNMDLIYSCRKAIMI